MTLQLPKPRCFGRNSTASIISWVPLVSFPSSLRRQETPDKGLTLEKELEYSYTVIWSASTSENPSHPEQQQGSAETPFPT